MKDSLKQQKTCKKTKENSEKVEEKREKSSKEIIKDLIHRLEMHKKSKRQQHFF